MCSDSFAAYKEREEGREGERQDERRWCYYLHDETMGRSGDDARTLLRAGGARGITDIMLLDVSGGQRNSLASSQC